MYHACGEYVPSSLANNSRCFGYMPSHMSEAAAQCDQLKIAKNAPLNFQNAPKNAPAQNVNFFYCIFERFGGGTKIDLSENYKKIVTLISIFYIFS